MAARTKARSSGESSMLGVRLSAEVVGRINAHAERMKKANAFALTISQSDALRDLILRGLTAAEDRVA